MRIIFLGTGASGGTQGSGKSKRMESSLFLTGSGVNILIDATRDFQKQIKDYKIDAVLLTHGHKDASGGAGRLPAGCPVFTHPKTLKIINGKFKPMPVTNGEEIKLGSWAIKPFIVPHSRDPRFPTFAWELNEKKRIIYASDMAEITEGFKKICNGADLLIVDGATWQRKIFSHLRVDQDLPKLCKLNAGRIILTQIGKSAPPHEEFEKQIAMICPKAIPAYDGLTVTL